jgi:hypothetical protein
MHSLRIVAISVAVSLWACGEEDPGVLVNDDIAWQLGCPSGVTGCTSFHGHRQKDVEEEFKAGCDKNSGGLDVRIEDPGSAADNRPGSVLKIEGLDPKTGTCGSVTVTEAPDLEANEGDFGGSCEAAECVITGGADEGWNFKGTIECNNLVDGQGNPRTLQAPGGGGGVPLAVDNCG